MLTKPQPSTMTSDKRIPVVVHAPDPITREGAMSQLRRHPEIRLVTTAAPGDTSVAVLLAESFDHALLTRLRKVVRADGMRPVLVVNRIREAELLDVIECGVGAIVWRREATDRRLLRAVASAFRGDGDLPSDLLGRLINQVGAIRPGSGDAPGAQPAGLTPREVEVLRLVSRGLNGAEIAEKLSYSERTVKNIVQGITTRLDLRNRAHAVAYALREGYIS